MIDLDAKFVYSRTVTIKLDKSDPLNAHIKPNPFADQVTIDINLTHNSAVTVDFIDLYGRVILTKQFKGYKGGNTFQVTGLDNMPAATYMIRMTTDDETVSRKLMKK